MMSLHKNYAKSDFPEGSVAVLIPCFNEASTIENVVRGFRMVLPEADIYVYDNNSTDDTAKRALDAGAIVRHEYRQGKGNVIRRMFREINAECYIMTDGDGTYPAECAPEMTRLVLEQEIDMVVGDRLSTTYFRENTRLFHGAGNAFVRMVINQLFSADIRDIMTGYRAFSYEFVKTFPVLSEGFEIETEMSIHAADKNLNTCSIPVTYRERQEGSVSKLNTFSDGARILRMITRMFRTYRPLAFFGVLSLILLLLSSVFLMPVLQAYYETGMVDRFPTLIVCGFTFLASMISFFVGLILNTLRLKDRQDFEMRLVEASYRKQSSIELNNIKKNESVRNECKEESC